MCRVLPSLILSVICGVFILVMNGCTSLNDYDKIPVITSSNSVFTTVGSAFSYTATATGTPTPTITFENLPTWLTANGATVSGTPTTSQSEQFTVVATNSKGKTTLIVSISPQQTPVITSSTSVMATVGLVFSYTATATGTPEPTISFSNLPSWLTANGAMVSGTPTTTGSVQFTVIATNAAGQVTKTVTVTESLSSEIPIITSVTSVSAVVGQVFSHTATATGTPTPTISFSNLPSWLTANGATVSGTPTTTGSVQFTVIATNAAGQTTQTVTVTASQTSGIPIITSSTSVSATVGQVFSYTATANGTPAPTISFSNLPSWLTANGATVSGTPTTTGSVQFTVIATNTAGQTTKTVTIIKLQTSEIPNITSSNTVSATVGQVFYYTATATGTPAPTISFSNLPSWLTANGATVSGTPTTTGSVQFTVIATNVAGQATKTVTVTELQTPGITSSNSISATVSQVFSYTATATGTPTPTISFSNLPSWLTANGATVSGTPTTTGTVQFTVIATNMAGQTTQTVTITKMQTPSITSVNSVSATVGQVFSYTATATGTPTPTISFSNLPSWLTANGATVSGIPTTGGSEQFTVIATNTAGQATQAVTITELQTPNITSANSVSATVGYLFSYTASATGTPTPIITFSDLPLWLNANGATVSGTPVGTGSVHFTVSATNIVGQASNIVTVSCVPPPPPFCIVIDTSILSRYFDNGRWFCLPLNSAFDYNFTVDWGDTTRSVITSATDNNLFHTYPNTGIYTIRIFENVAGGFPAIYFNFDGDCIKVIDITSWGGGTWYSMSGAFSGCRNLTISATDAATAKTSNVTDFSDAWFGCGSLTSFPSLDTSSGTNFSRTWSSCIALTSFPSLDTSSGTNFSHTWSWCSSLTSFPCLDTSNGTDFLGTWSGCSSLTSFPLLDTSKGTNFSATWEKCGSLTSFPSINTSSGTTFPMTWFGCDKLTNFPTLDFSKMTEGTGCFGGDTLSSDSYSNILINLANYNTNHGVTFSGGNSKYIYAATAARNTLTISGGWTITDGGTEASAQAINN